MSYCAPSDPHHLTKAQARNQWGVAAACGWRSIWCWKECE